MRLPRPNLPNQPLSTSKTFSKRWKYLYLVEIRDVAGNNDSGGCGQSNALAATSANRCNSFPLGRKKRFSTSHKSIRKGSEFILRTLYYLSLSRNLNHSCGEKHCLEEWELVDSTKSETAFRSNRLDGLYWLKGIEVRSITNSATTCSRQSKLR